MSVHIRSLQKGCHKMFVQKQMKKKACPNKHSGNIYTFIMLYRDAKTIIEDFLTQLLHFSI